MIVDRKRSVAKADDPSSANGDDDVTRNGIVLVAAGPDQVYFSRDTIDDRQTIANFEEASKFDDIVYADGYQ